MNAWSTKQAWIEYIPDCHTYSGPNITPPKSWCNSSEHGAIDSTKTKEEMIEIAYKMHCCQNIPQSEKPNILIKVGKNGSWYLKKIDKSDIETKKRHHTSRTMYIIEWK